MAKDFWAADAETDPFKHGRVPKPFIFGAYNPKTDEYEEFSTALELVDFFRDKNVVVYFHNGGKFDAHFILPYIEEQTEIMLIAGRVSKFKIGLAEYRDSMNLLPMGLAAFKKDKFDYKKMEADVRHKHMDEIRIYLRNDCVYLAEVLARFFKEYGRQITLASAAMKQCAKILGIKTPDTSALLYKDISEFYYGGRVQCFRDGIIKKKFKVIDIKSAYPRAMVEDHPYGETYDESTELPKERSAIQRSFISITCPSTGCFPYRENDALEFPADHKERTFNITGWEYLAALETKAIDGRARINRVITFSERINFRPYVDHFFALKQAAEKEGDVTGRNFAKLFLNACYGKFSANPAEYDEFLTVDPRDVETCEKPDFGFTRVQPLYNTHLMSRPLPEENRRYYNVAVGASITGWVRAYMWRALCSVKGLLYCDTDSIACEDIGALKLGKELGDWDLEGEFKKAAIGGKKLYAFEYVKPLVKDGETITHKTASKGVKLTAKELEDIADGKTVVYTNDAPTFSIVGKHKAQFITRTIRKRQTK